MSSRLLIYLTVAIGVAIAFEFGSIVGDGNYFIAGLILTVLIAMAAISVVGRNASLEARLLAALVAGYFIAGKGFAYITPAPPVYIGELVLGCLGILYIVRIATKRIDRIGPPFLCNILIVIGVYALTRLLLVDFWRFNMLAIRDFATEYYILYFFVAYQAFQNEQSRDFFLGAAKWTGLLAVVIMIVMEYGLDLIALSYRLALFGEQIFLPHADIWVPIFCSAVVWISTGNGEARAQTFARSMAGALLITIVLPGYKVAFTSSLLGVFIFLMFAGRKTLIFRFVIFGAIAGVVMALALNSVYLFGSTRIAENLKETIETRLDGMKFDNVFSESGRGGKMESGSTKEWRVKWWERIKSDVDATNPLFGLGLGSDITTPFMEDYFGATVLAADNPNMMARYAHNIIFTTLGRLGYVGLALWSVFFIAFVRIAGKAARQVRSGVAVPYLLPVWSFVIGGFCDAFVQSTYENPYAGIPFWAVLALAVRMYEAGEAKRHAGNTNPDSSLELSGHASDLPA